LSGDGGPAVRADLDYPSLVHVDLNGNVFITEYIEARVRKIDAKTRAITTVAGNGVTRRGDDRSNEGDLATRRSLDRPAGLASDAQGNLILSDSTRILKIDKSTQRMTMLVGETTWRPPLPFPSELTIDRSDNIYFAEKGRIRVLRPDKGLETIYEKRTEGTIRSPVVDGNGSLYFIESNCIFQMELSSKKVSHFAGRFRTSPTGNFSGDGGPAVSAGMDNPSGLAVDSRGNLYVSDWIANRIRRIDRTTRIIQTIAGNGEPRHPRRALL
jgi:sugar lactone lactonase YvrE